MNEDIIFDVITPVGFSVRCTREYWNFIVNNKHPIMNGKEQEVIEVLTHPLEVRKSNKDENIFLFYSQGLNHLVCAVTKKQSENKGFLITTYPTDAIKAGEVIWKK